MFVRFANGVNGLWAIVLLFCRKDRCQFTENFRAKLPNIELFDYLCVDKLRFDITCYYSMGQLAFLKMFLLVSIPTDINDNRRHIHVFRKGTRHMRSIAKIWIEQNGRKCVEIADPN